MDRGKWCDRMSNRYYYHKGSNTCRGFHYTGCGKSQNNFREFKECEEHCIKNKINKIILSSTALINYNNNNNTLIKSNLIY